MSLFLDLMIVGGLIALASHILLAADAHKAVVALIAFGLLLGLAWVRLGAVDVALAEAAIGGGLTGLLLLRAAARRLRPAGPAPLTWRRAGPAIAIGLVAALGLGFAILALPRPAPGLAPAVAGALPETGLGNPVTAVLLAYRALDTLLEKIVLLLALVGVWSLASDRDWGRAPALAVAQPPEAFTFLARVLPPFGLVVAVYQVWVGADAPGGTFQAGAILAALWLLVLMAGLAPAPAVAHARLRLMLAGGPALFIGIGFLGAVVAPAFLAYPPDVAKPLIVSIEVALTLSVAIALAMVVAGPPGRASAP